MALLERKPIFDRFNPEELPPRRSEYGVMPDYGQAGELFPGLNRRMDKRYVADDARKRKALPFFHDRVCSAAVFAMGRTAEAREA